MRRLEIPLAFSFLVVNAACTVETGEETESASNEITVCTPPLTPPPDPCAYHVSGTADATITMGPGVTEEEEQVPAPPAPEPPFSIFGSCPANVVDVKVPSTSSPNPNDCNPNGCYDVVEMAAGAGTFAGSVTDGDSDYFKLPNTESSCSSFSLWARLYTKLAGESAFTFKKKYSYHGVWKGSYCSVETSCSACQSSCTKSYFPNDLYAPLPPESGLDVYRMVTAAKANGSYVATRVKAGYEPK